MPKNIKEIKLSKLERTLLYNFVIGEHNKIIFPNTDNLKTSNNEMSVEVKVGLSYTNLNNFDGDKKKYGKALSKLIKKFN